MNVGSAEGSDIYCHSNLSVIYEPYLVLNRYASNFKLNQGNHLNYYNDSTGYNSSITSLSCVADLTRNNLGEDVSNLGHIHDDEVMFLQVFGFIHYIPVPLISGRAVCELRGDVYGDISIYFDDETVTLDIFNIPDFVSIVFNSSAYPVGGDSSLRQHNIILSDNVTWLTYIWKYLGDFKTEVNLIVDGNIYDNFTLESSFYHENKNNYSSNVWNAIESYNDFLFNDISYHMARVFVCLSLDNGIDDFSQILELYNGSAWNYSSEDYFRLTNNETLFIPTLLNLIKNRYGLSNDEMDFVCENYAKVRDSIDVFIAYFGYEREKFEFNIGNSTETFYIGGDYRLRHAEISCVNGSYAHLDGRNSTNYSDIWYNHHRNNGSIDWEYGYNYGHYADASYDGLMTFAFACDKVNNDILEYYLLEKNRTDANGSLVYDNGLMKAAYGSFLEGLLVIYMNDLVADAAAERFNVSWTRISPMVMSVHDNVNRSFMSGESDFHFGREAYGDADAVKAFYFACSSTFSPIEHYVGETLFPGTGDLGAVTTALGHILNHNGTLEIFVEDGCVLIRELNNNSNVLIYDNSTGLLHDAYVSINGAYCYSNQQTEWAFDLGEELLLFADSIRSFLLGNMMDLSFLNSSTLKLVKSCYAFLSMGAVFTEAITAESLTGISTIFAELGIESLSTIGGLVILPAVLFLNINPVGEEDGYVDNYWKTINNSGYGQNAPSYNEMVQIKRNNNDFDDRILRPNDRAEGMPYGFSNLFVLANSGPSDDNGSFVLKVAAGALITMLISPSSLFVASGINDNVHFELKYNETNEEYMIYMFNKKLGDLSV